LARKARLSREYVLRIEADLHDPTLSAAARLAEALGSSLDDLMKPPKTARHDDGARRRVRPMTEVQRPFQEALAARSVMQRGQTAASSN